MDQAIIATYSSLVLQHQSSAEDILEDPMLRGLFLAGVRQSVGETTPERDLLHRLSSLRKQSRLPRSRDILAIASPLSLSEVQS